RKMLVLFSAGFALTSENESELTATIDACNKANVAIYSLDARGLVAPNAVSPRGGSARNNSDQNIQFERASEQRHVRKSGANVVLASYPASTLFAADPQRPGGGAPSGGGGAPGGGGRPSGGAPSGGAPGGGTGGGTPGGGTTGGGGKTGAPGST